MGFWVELSDGSREWLSEFDVHAVMGVLWQSEGRGTTSLIAELSHARSSRRDSVAGLTAAEESAFRMHSVSFVREFIRAGDRVFHYRCWPVRHFSAAS